ncbi:O-antigen ligase family protein [Azospirillum sp. sgz301742]
MLRRFHFWCLLIVVTLAPLPLGTNRPWSWTLLATLVGLLCLTWPLALWRDKGTRTVAPGRILVPSLLFAAALAWAMVQSVPGVPDQLWHPLWRDAAAALAPDVQTAGRIGLDERAALDGVMRLLCYGGVFWLALLHTRSSRRAHHFVEGLAIAGGLYAVYGLLLHVSGSETILWMEKWAYRGDVTATFVNRNTFATYAGLALLCAVAAAAHRMGAGPIRLVTLLRHVRRPTIVFPAAALVLAAALLGTGSRAGVAAAASGLGVLVAGLLVASRPQPRTGVALVTAGVGVVTLAGFVTLLWLRRDAMPDLPDRLRIYAMALDAIAGRPWLGSGLGSFPAVFAMERPLGLMQVWDQAHNTYLELALELGIPAAAALILAVLWLAGLCVRGILVRHTDRVYPALGLAATVLVGMHAMLDYSMQVPAVAVTWAAIVGAGVAQSWSSRA